MVTISKHRKISTLKKLPESNLECNDTETEFLSRYVSRYFRQVTIHIVTFCIPLCASPFFSLKDLQHTSVKIKTNI